MVLAAAVTAGAATGIGRQGYSTDEEFTVFAVAGIRQSGLPLLPSGFLYDRGLAYSYTSWLAGELFGHDLPVYRAAALASAAGALIAIGVLVRDVAGGPASMFAAALVGSSLPFWAAATTARFYAPFLLLYALALQVILRLRLRRTALTLEHPGTRLRSLDVASRVTARQALGNGGHQGTMGTPGTPSHQGTPGTPGHLGTMGTLLALCVLSFVCRLTHELALSLVAIPAAVFLYRVARRKVRGLADLAPWVAPTLAIVAGLAAAQALIIVLHQFAPDSGQTMIRRFFLWQLLNLFGSAVEALDFFWHIARTWPLVAVSVVALALIRMLGIGTPWTGAQGFAHVLWIGWVVFFGVIDSGITINYLLVPAAFMMAALAVDLAAVTPRRALPYVSLLFVLAVAAEQWGGPSAAAERLEAARPTITLPGAERLRNLAAQASRVACTDELACLTLVGRVDTWLALDPFLRERFVVVRNGREEGVYAGSPVATRLTDLFAPIDGRIPESVLVVDVFKDLPVGPSSRFVTRALAAESVDALPIVETARLRVVELRLRSQLARAGSEP